MTNTEINGMDVELAEVKSNLQAMMLIVENIVDMNHFTARFLRAKLASTEADNSFIDALLKSIDVQQRALHRIRTGEPVALGGSATDD